jgi:hypothetical protein
MTLTHSQNMKTWSFSIGKKRFEPHFNWTLAIPNCLFIFCSNLSWLIVEFNSFRMSRNRTPSSSLSSIFCNHWSHIWIKAWWFTLTILSAIFLLRPGKCDRMNDMQIRLRIVYFWKRLYILLSQYKDSSATCVGSFEVSVLAHMSISHNACCSTSKLHVLANKHAELARPSQ